MFRAIRWLPSALTATLWLLGSGRAAALGTCGTGGELGTRMQITFEGSVYYVTTPPGYTDSRPWPVIFGLHGDEGDPAKSVNSLWAGVTDDRFIFIAPKAPNVANMGSWYKDQASNEAWMDKLLAKVFASYNVDVDRIYIWGLSGGAQFNSNYVMKRQKIFAAAEWNMGGRRVTYVDPPKPPCKIPTRFVVSTTDFLRNGALMLHALFRDKGHEAVWVDANCMDHCFDRVEAGVNARDWMLAHTHCGGVTPAGCGSAGDLPGGTITSPPDAGPRPDASPGDGSAGSADAPGGTGGAGGGVGGAGGSIDGGVSGMGGADGGGARDGGNDSGESDGSDTVNRDVGAGGAGGGTGGAGGSGGHQADAGGAMGGSAGTGPGPRTAAGGGCSTARGTVTSGAGASVFILALIFARRASRRRT